MIKQWFVVFAFLIALQPLAHSAFTHTVEVRVLDEFRRVVPNAEVEITYELSKSRGEFTTNRFVTNERGRVNITIRNIEYPMLADPARRVCREYGTLIENEGLSLGATFLIDPNGMLKAFEFHDNSIGRSVDELLRKLRAAKFVVEHGDEVSPMNWKPGDKVLKPALETRVADAV